MSLFAWTVALKLTEALPEPVAKLLSFVWSVNVYEPPAETTSGVVLVGKVHVTVQLPAVQALPLWVAVKLDALVTLTLFASRRTKVEVAVVEVTALPLKVRTSVRSIADPALFAVSVTFATL